MDYILEIENISKSFPGVKALNEITMKVKQGEIHALVGENGAGKSTLIKLLSGIHNPDCGSIIFCGNFIINKSPSECICLGISTVHQELKLVEELTVAENIFLGEPIIKQTTLGKSVQWKAINNNAQNMLDSMGISINAKTLVKELSVAKKQIVEICKALRRNSKMIILDEPSATLTEVEIDVLFKILCKLREDGITIIYISHRLEEIYQIADNVTVLRDGNLIVTDKIENMDRQKLIQYMVGREIDNIYPPKHKQFGEKILDIRNLKSEGVLHDISFSLHEGEILGIAGLVGSGRTELARAIFGADRIDSGEVIVKGKSVKIKKVTDAIKASIGLVPEERKIQGILPELTVANNITITGIDKIIKGGFLNKRLEKKYASKFIDQLRIVTPNEDFKICDLSGGNQQKTVLAKWLMANSDVLIFDEPTRGIDVGAKQEIYRILKDIASEGKAIIIISSELPEILGISHRILVMHDGRITGELDADQATQEMIMNFAIS